MERGERTRAALLAAARGQFAERGYERTSLDVVTAEAGVTKGALYHHFGSKPALFAAVYEMLEAELAQRSARAAQAASDPLAMLRLGMEAFLEACLDADVRRIILIDGLSVLGWERWAELAQRHNLGMIETVLRQAMVAGVIHEAPVSPLAHLLQGALIQAGMALARAEDPERARADTASHLAALLDGLRA